MAIVYVHTGIRLPKHTCVWYVVYSCILLPGNQILSLEIQIVVVVPNLVVCEIHGPTQCYYYFNL